MAQDPLKPRDGGKVKLPRVDAGMNKIAPTASRGGKDGQSTDIKNITLGAKPRDRTALLVKAMLRMDKCIQAEAENRKPAVDDLKFKNGEQWPADVAAQRNFDKRPCLTINKLPTFINQITNDQRQNRPAINISPVGDKGDPEVAKMYRGLIRAIERNSSADIAYDTAFDSAVSMGWGYWRVTTEYESAESFDQVIHIKRIRNPFTVYLDPDHQEPDGADAKYGFVTEMLSRSDFEDQYPDADPVQWSQGGAGESLKNWIAQDQVRIAEYFEIKYEKRTLVALSNGHVGWEDELDDHVMDLIVAGTLEVENTREADVPKVKWYKLTAKEVLDEREWPGKWIPVIKVIGNEIDIEGKSKLSGLVRNAKDPQRMVNYWETAFTELVALQPKAPWIMEEGQVEGHETMWKQANIKAYPYLLYKATSVAGKPAPPPQRQPFGGIPAGVQQAISNAAQNMMAVTGIRFDATLSERMHDESGKAIRELRRSGDLGSFHYVDNLARSLKHCGAILIDLIPKVYDTKRMLTILREDDTEERVQLDPSAPKPMQEGKRPDGKTLKIFNPTYGEYGVTVTIGPSYATKRIEASQSMMDFAKALPNTAALIADLIAKNQDWPGAPEMATRLAKALPPNLLAPEMKDVPPQVQALLSSMDGQIKQMGQERVAMMKALNDQQADRLVDVEKINKDFEAKVLKVVADMETKMAAVQQKAEQSMQTQVGAKIEGLAQGVQALMEALAAPPAKAAAK